MWSAFFPISNYSRIRQLQFATHAFSQKVLQQAVQISIYQWIGLFTNQKVYFILLKMVFHSKFPIFAIFLNIHKASPNTDHNIICMFLKRKTISKPEKSSLSYTNQGKTTILPRANNGIQLVYLQLFAISMALFYLILLIYA